MVAMTAVLVHITKATATFGDAHLAGMAVWSSMFVRCVLNDNGPVPGQLLHQLHALCATNSMTHGEQLAPAIVRAAKRSAHFGLQKSLQTIMHIDLDLSRYSAEFLGVIAPHLLSEDLDRRTLAFDCVRFLSFKSSDPEALKNMLLVMSCVEQSGSFDSNA